MTEIRSKLHALKEKKSIGGWVLWLLLLLWNLPSEGQNLAWWRQHLPMPLTAHSALISWFLAVGGVVWMMVIVLWPKQVNHLWLEFEGKELRLQNTQRYSDFRCGGKNRGEICVGVRCNPPNRSRGLEGLREK